MRRLKKISLLLMMSLCCVCLLAGCRKKATDEETEAASSPAAVSSVRETAAAASGNLNSDSAIVPAVVNYEKGEASSAKSKVQYPVLDDVSEEANDLIQKNAESILEAYAPGEDDELSITCDVIAMDKSRATIIYQGTFTKGDDDPVKVFCSNTVDLNKASSITFKDLADPATVAAYILSDDCYFTNLAGNLSAENKASLMDARTSMSQAQYETLLKNADFPVSLDKTTYFPGCFSFEKDGVIYFTIPVAHALGDYAMITFAPETK